MSWRMTSWVALAVTLAGPVVYLLTLGVPFLSKTGLFMFVLAAAGAILGIVAAVKLESRAGTVLAVVNVGLALFVVIGFFIGSRLPTAGSGVSLHARAPDFVLPDHTGKTIRLSEELAKGPVLLVFYRGHW